MSPDTQITLSLMLTLGVPLALAVRELTILRYGGWGRRRDPVKPDAPPPAGKPGGPVLPACLIPNLPPLQRGTREKVRELA